MTLALFTGLILGIVFYGALWLTVLRLPASRHPVAFTIASYWLRIVCVVAGFLFVTRGSWRNVLACCAGLMAGRAVVTRWSKCT